MDPRRRLSIGSSGSTSNDNTCAGSSYQPGKQQVQSAFQLDLAAAAVVSANNSFATQGPEFRLPRWQDYSPTDHEVVPGLGTGHVDSKPASSDDEEFQNINAFVLGNEGVVDNEPLYSDYLHGYNELISEEISWAGYSAAGECSFRANGSSTFIQEPQSLGYLSGEAFGEPQSVRFDLPLGTSCMDLDFSGNQPENLMEEFWPPYAFTNNLHDLEDPTSTSSSTGVEFQHRDRMLSNSNFQRVDVVPLTPAEIWNSSQSDLQTELEPKPLLMFDPIPMTEAEMNSIYRLSALDQPLLELEPSLGSEGSTGSCHHVDGIGKDTQSLVDSLTESFHELEVKEPSQNDWVVCNTNSTSQSFDLESQTQTWTRELKSQPNTQHVNLSRRSRRQDPYDEGKDDGSSNSVLSTCTASTNESRVGPRENVASLADGDIDWAHEKDIIISRMLGKRDAINLPEDVMQEVADILKDFENYWKRDVSNVNFMPRQERSLRCFQRTITLTLNAYCEREKRRVRYLPDFCKHALSDWVSIEAHQQNPYPDKSIIRSLANELGLTCTQVEQWFENYRVRTWKPTQTGIRKGKFFRYPAERTAILKRWILDHKDDPKPQGKDLKELIESTGMTNAQVKQWCYNYRRRHKRDMQK